LATATTDRGWGRTSPYDVLLGRWSVAVSCVVVVATLIGVSLGWRGGGGIDLCWFHWLSGLPCPGCGLTRAVLSLGRGEVGAAFRLHPFALLVLPYAAVASTSAAWPRRLRHVLRRALEARRRAFSRIYGALIVLFVAHGLLRLAAVGAGLLPWR